MVEFATKRGGQRGEIEETRRDGLAPLVRHVEGGSALRLEGGARDPLVAAYLGAVARTAEYVNRLG